MTTTPRNLLRTLLTALGLSAVLLAGCGGDDGDGKDAASSSTSKQDDSVDKADADGDGNGVCDRLELDDLSSRTGETFTKTAATASDTCTYSNDEGSAMISLAVHKLTEEDGSPDSLMDEGRSACAEGTLDDSVEVEGAEQTFACSLPFEDGEAPSVAAIRDGWIYLISGTTVDPSIGSDEILAALADLLPGAF